MHFPTSPTAVCRGETKGGDEEVKDERTVAVLFPSFIRLLRDNFDVAVKVQII